MEEHNGSQCRIEYAFVKYNGVRFHNSNLLFVCVQDIILNNIYIYLNVFMIVHI